MDTKDRDLGELPYDVRSIVGSFLLPEIVEAKVDDEKMIRSAARYVIGAPKSLPYEESVFISGLRTPYSINDLARAAERGYFETAKYLYEFLKEDPAARLLLTKAVIVADDLKSFEIIDEEMGPFDLREVLWMSAGGRGDQIFRWAYDQYRDLMSSETVSDLFYVAISAGNNAVARFLLGGYLSGTIPPFMVDRQHFTKAVTDSEPDVLRGILRLYQPTNAEIENVIIRTPIENIRVLVEDGYRPSPDIVNFFISSMSLDAVRLFSNPPVNMNILAPEYWNHSINVIKYFIDNGIIPPQEALIKAVKDNIQTRVYSGTAFALIPYIRDKSTLLDDLSDVNYGKFRELIRLGAIPSKNSLSSAIRGGDMKVVDELIRMGLRPSPADLSFALANGREELYNKYKNLYPASVFLTEEVGRKVDEDTVFDIIEKAKIIEPSELNQIILGAIKGRKYIILHYVLELFPDVDFYKILLESGSPVRLDDIEFLLGYYYPMGTETTLQLLKMFGKDIEYKITSRGVASDGKKLVKRLARSGETSAALNQALSAKLSREQIEDLLRGTRAYESTEYKEFKTRPYDQLIRAIREGDPDDVKRAIEVGADVTLNGNHAIKLAFDNKSSIPILEELYRHGADLGAGDHYPLRRAIMSDDTEGLVWLLERIDLPPDAVDFAMRNDKRRSIPFLLEAQRES